MTGLRKIRIEIGLIQCEAASALWIKPSAYSHYENGIREPNLGTLVKISDFFGVSIDFLVRGEEFKAPQK